MTETMQRTTPASRHDTRHWLVERARVVGQFDGGVWVEAQPQSGCGGCTARGCGRGLLARWRRPARLPLDTNAPLSLGDPVQVGVPARGILRSALIVYGWPLLLAIVVGALTERLLSPGHVGVPLSFAAGLLLGLLAGRWQLRRHPRRYRPVLLSTEP